LEAKSLRVAVPLFDPVTTAYLQKRKKSAKKIEKIV